MNMIQIICASCGRELENIRSGVWVKELFQRNKEVYRVWAADYLSCPKCGDGILACFADNPIVEHFEKEKMAETLTQCKKRTLGFNLFEWKEFVPLKKPEPEFEIVTEGDPKKT